MSLRGQEGPLSVLTIHYLVGTAAGISHEIERHELGLFSTKDMLEVFRAAGLKVRHTEPGLCGRGMFVAQH
jgi:hypothetical protein